MPNPIYKRSEKPVKIDAFCIVKDCNKQLTVIEAFTGDICFKCALKKKLNENRTGNIK